MTKILYKIYGGVLSYLIQYMVGICLDGVHISLCMPHGSNKLLQIIKKVTHKKLMCMFCYNDFAENPVTRWDFWQIWWIKANCSKNRSPVS